MNQKYLLITIAVIGLITFPNLLGYPPASASKTINTKTHLTEAFDLTLSSEITTVDRLVQYINQNYTGERNTAEFLNYISSVVSSRFYHGYSYYSMNDNWMAALAGRLFWKDLSAIVLPDDILKHPNAACSQQGIVLMECVKRFGLDYRKIFFDHHFAAEVKISGKWHFIDVNLEVKPGNKSLKELVKHGTLYSLYQNKIPANEIHSVLAHPKYGEVNSKNAPKAEFFHQITGWASHYFLPLLLCLQLFALYWYDQKSTQSLLKKN